MIEPWNLRTEHTRIEDSLINFIIYCEDEVSERVYFKFFETSRIKVNVIPGQKSKETNVFNAITCCNQDGLMIQKEGLLYLEAKDTQVWCVYDRDIDPNNRNLALENTKFNESIATAHRAGINVAWSNDAFELWVLLHFRDINELDPIYEKRTAYYDHLTTIFEDWEPKNDDLQRALGYANFSYKTSLKSETNFRSIVRPEMIKNTLVAISRAERIENYHSTRNVLNHQKFPCTLVHHLVKELIHHGGKL
jgi:hypothetical protein